MDILVAFLLAILSGMGVGSGGLFMIYLLLAKDVPQLEAQGLNLLFFLFSAGASVPLILLRRRVPTGVLLAICLCGAAGVLIGAKLSGIIAAEILKKLFAFLILGSGIVGLLPKKRKKK